MKDKPEDNIVKLNFDSKSHDAKVETAIVSDEERRLNPKRKAIKRQMYRTYQRWTAKVKSKPRTPKEILAATYGLQTEMGAFEPACRGVGLDEYHAFTMQVIEDKLATIISTEIVARNEITPFVPDRVTLLDDDNDAIVAADLKQRARPTVFGTLEELKAIPFVKQAMEKQGFVGLCLHHNGLVAVYNDGMTVGVGFLANSKGIEKLPTLEEYSAALAAATKGEKQ